MKKLPVGFIKLKIRFLNLLDFFVYREDFELRKLKQLKQSSSNHEQWMKTDWNLRAKRNPFYFVRTVKNQSEEDFWESGYADRNAILESKSIKERFGKRSDNLKVLEIGCGIGRILIPMSEKFQESIGIDISQEMVNIGKQKTKNYSNCKILLNNGMDLSDLSSNYFDFCYSFIVFQHIPKKLIIKNYIKEVARILKPSSCFRFQVRGMHLVDPIKLRLLEKIGKKESICSEDTWLGVQFSSQEMQNIAEEFGFEIIEESGEDTEYYWLTFCLKEKQLKP